MLKKIPPIIPPELLMLLAQMGHGDEIVLGDANFPAASNAKRLVRCDGHPIPELLDAILQLMPLDTYVDAPVVLMQTGEGEPRPEIWDEYRKTVDAHQQGVAFEKIGRFEFYERAAQAYAIVATGERALYANVILKKGVIK